jgi:hypothetical protein
MEGTNNYVTLDMLLHTFFSGADLTTGGRTSMQIIAAYKRRIAHFMSALNYRETKLCSILLGRELLHNSSLVYREKK